MPVDTEAIIRISQRHGAVFLALFGSVARDDAGQESDVDVLVRFISPKSLLDLAEIEGEMSESLGRNVDLLTEGAISPYIRERLGKEMRVLYDKRS